LKDFGFCYFTTKSASDLEDYNKLKKKHRNILETVTRAKSKSKL